MVFENFYLKTNIDKNRESWSIRVYTSNQLLSGSTTDVFIQIYGDMSYSPKIKLENAEKFKKDSIKNLNFTFVSYPIGEVLSIEISIPELIPIYYDWNLFKVKIFVINQLK